VFKPLNVCVRVINANALDLSLFQFDYVVSLASQPLISIADFSWVLHHAPEAGTLPAIIRRGDAKKPLNLVLPSEWRTKTDISGQRHCPPRQPTRRALLANAIKGGEGNT
jgi:hypothetical protein